ncbi:M28 family peptidase [Bradyrhizobium sp. DASA03007]|uniref:M28 family peptidase n=1 Tax=unclassified Bradyrhizobium TaxID=2631580 RepID=UPI003F6F6A7B
MSDIETIISMLSYRRPAGSGSEMEFIKRFIIPLGATMDKHGNWRLTIGNDPTVLWSSHTDSVHHSEGYQKVDYDGKFISLPANSKSSCLGADCAAGVWIMSEMIKAKVPGLYVFHFAEEIGCVGSRAIVEKEPGLLKNIQAAIAFDRRGTTEIITHQGVRTASDAFADSVALQLPNRFKPSDKGVLTDTKQYRGLVAECTNIAVGYYNEHRPHEALDTHHLIELRNHMIQFDQSKVVIERDPLAPEKRKLTMKDIGKSSFGSLRYRREETLRDLVWHHADKVAAFLENTGVTFDQLHDAIYGQKQPTLGSVFDDVDDLFSKAS